MKIIKPDRTECLFRVVSQSSGANCLAFGLLHMFALRGDAEDTFAEPGALWSIAQKAMGTDAVLDEGWPKARGEFLVYGSAHTDPTSNAQPLSVVVEVGERTKKLAVFGDRTFNALGLMSAPSNWSSMPITPSNAYGGIECSENPAGRGANEVKSPATGTYAWPLPNIEDPNALMAQRSDRPKPAGFWGWPASSPQRQAYLGMFDKKWLDARWPHLPVDTDPAYFQTAPQDQQLASFFAGNEAISLLNLHPQIRHIKSQLPGMRSRIFFQRKRIAEQESNGVERNANNDSIFYEVESKLETVWLFPEELCGVALFRGVGEVALPEADDVLYVYADLEPISSARAGTEEHERQFLIRSGQVSDPERLEPNSPAEVDAVFEAAVTANVADVSVPEVDVAEIKAPDPKAVQKFIDDVEKDTYRENPELKSAMDNMQNIMKQFGVTMEDVNKMRDNAAESPLTFTELQAQLRENGPKLLDFLEKFGLSDAELIKQMAELPDMKQYTDVVANTPGGMKGVLNELDSLYAYFIAEEKRIDAQAQEDAIKAEQDVKAKDEVANTETPEEQDARLLITDLRQLVVTRHARKKDVKGLDLTGADLSDLTLEGMDFSGATLVEANFEKSRLQNCRFDETLLNQARFVHADVSGASFQAASASDTIFSNCRLVKVNLTQADFSVADFTDAQLSESVIAFTDFSGAKMAGAQLAACRGEFASFVDCDLSTANFADANLRGVNFTNARLDKADLSRAVFKRGVLHGVDMFDAVMRQINLMDSEANERTRFVRVDMTDADLTGAVWNGVELEDVILNQARLSRGDFSGSKLKRVKMIRAVAKNLVLDKCTLEEVDLSGVNMFEGSLSKAVISRSTLQLANFFGVDFSETKLDGIDLEGSLIDRTILHARQREA